MQEGEQAWDGVQGMNMVQDTEYFLYTQIVVSNKQSEKWVLNKEIWETQYFGGNWSLWKDGPSIGADAVSFIVVASRWKVMEMVVNAEDKRGTFVC